jgi:hypothetical protein
MCKTFLPLIKTAKVTGREAGKRGSGKAGKRESGKAGKRKAGKRKAGKRESGKAGKRESGKAGKRESRKTGKQRERESRKGRRKKEGRKEEGGRRKEGRRKERRRKEGRKEGREEGRGRKERRTESTNSVRAASSTWAAWLATQQPLGTLPIQPPRRLSCNLQIRFAWSYYSMALWFVILPRVFPFCLVGISKCFNFRSLIIWSLKTTSLIVILFQGYFSGKFLQ